MVGLMYSLAAAAVINTAAAVPPATPTPPASAAASRAPKLADPYSHVAFGYALAIDDELLWGHNLNGPHAPASLVKLLAALVLLDSRWNPDELLTVSETASHMTRPRVGLRAGDKVRAQDSLTAMLVQSANDACLTLVEHSGLGVAGFAAEMNARAITLGMRDTRVAHPCGFDAAGQHSTVSDLMRLARAAYADPRVARIVGMQGGTLRTAAGMQLSFNSSNQLLGRLDGVIGMKTGYTAEAGDCVIALAERSGHRVWLVLLDSRERWFAAHRIVSDALAVAASRDVPRHH